MLEFHLRNPYGFQDWDGKFDLIQPIDLCGSARNPRAGDETIYHTNRPYVDDIGTIYCEGQHG